METYFDALLLDLLLHSGGIVRVNDSGGLAGRVLDEVHPVVAAGWRQSGAMGPNVASRGGRASHCGRRRFCQSQARAAIIMWPASELPHP
jgi:hypothetical protein